MSHAYYNEFDPKAAAWLRELIKAGHIAPGVIDERSISDVLPNELSGYTQCHFFAGIGGWSYALRLTGWPDDCPVWTGSCPCQPFSAAGKQLGTADARHLWPQFAGLIAECRPATVFGEQVASKAGRLWLAGVRADLEGMGYGVGAADLCSAGVGSPNIRQRLFWMAHALRGRRNQGQGFDGEVCSPRCGQSEPSEHGCADGLEYSTGNGWLERWPESSGRSVAGGCEPSRLANADGGQSGHGELQPSGQYGQHPENGKPRWLADTLCERRRRRQSGGEDAGNARLAGKTCGFWNDFELLPCTDGKARRVEPGTFPLVAGLPGRVGLLRGYGNAINPELAAEFIQACEAEVTS